MNYFRLFWNRSLKFNWQFGLFLILLFGIPRFVLVLGANETGNYNFTSIIFIVMWLTPFLLLNKEGRKAIGIQKPKKLYSLLNAFILGIAICVIVYLLGIWLYGNTLSNWFVYISKSYEGSLPADFASAKHIFFISFVIVSMTFSPIGEELLYRGLIHESFVKNWGNKKHLLWTVRLLP